MKTGIILLGTFIVTFIIISPFFWLRFLYRKNRKLYVIYGTLIVVGIFIINIFYIEPLLTGYFAEENTDLYYLYYNINDWTFFVFFFLTLAYPFFVTKIIHDKFTLKFFFISLAFIPVIIIIHFLIFAFYVAPRAFESLNKNL